MKVLISIFIGLAFLIASCTKKSDYEERGCAGPSPSYESDIKPIIALHCLDACCHAQGGSNGNYSNYDGLLFRVKNGTLEKRVLQVKDMPQNAEPLSDQELQTIYCWIHNGAPKN